MRPQRIIDAFQAMPREHFLPESQRHRAAMDYPLPLSHGQTNSQPTTVANMLALLDVEPGMKVLDVGAGSGWTTALLAHLVGETGQVIGVERIGELTEMARNAVENQNIPWAEVRQARAGELGVPEEAPFERILVSAEAAALPESLVDQLGPGGVMVIPVRGVMVRVSKDDDGVAHLSRHGFYSFVPLVED